VTLILGSNLTPSLEPALPVRSPALVPDHTLTGLSGAEKERFNTIQLELAQLKNTFSNHVLDGTKAFSHRVTNKGARPTIDIGT
jgi:hypothetical protein